MEFRILGPLEVLDEECAITLGGSKQRALLAVLLLHANETLSTDRLIDELWGERPPSNAAKTVQMQISRLRKALAGESGNGLAGVLLTRERGYELTLDPERLDAHRFERLVAEGRTELAEGRPQRAVAALEEALSLWRGQPLAELAYEPFVQREIARLADLRVAALEQLIEAKLELGRHDEVLPQLETLIREHPYRERLRAQRMLALHRCDRQAESLQAYQDARRTLVEDLGIEPGEPLRTLHQRILEQDPALAVWEPSVAASEVERRAAARPPRPRRVAREPPLLEREHELGQLDRLLDAAREARGRLALVDGPAGIGKTRLLEEARERARATGLTVLTASGGELERDFGFGIVRQLLEPALARASAGVRDELFAGAAGLAEPLFAPEPDPGGLGGDPTHAVLHGLYWLVVNLGERSALLLAIDDVHWADEPSLRFLIHLARRLEGLPAAIVLARRTGEEAAQPELLRALELVVRSPIVRPGPLTEAGVESLVRAALGPDVRPALCAACSDATGGNPFLLCELLDELRRGAPHGEQIDPSAVGRLGPERIAAALLLRVGRLDPQAPALARAVAVLGRRGTAADAAQIAGIDAAQTHSLAGALVEAGVLDHGEPFRFIHPIVRSAIYRDIPAGKRAEMHARAARLLASEGSEPEAVAIHLLATAPDADATVVAVLAAAAGTALARGAPEPAARYLRRALAEPPPDDERATLLHMLGTAELHSGHPGGVATLMEAFKAAPKGRPRADVARTVGPVLGAQGRVEEAVACLEAAIAELPSDERELRLQLEAEVTTCARLSPATFARAGERLRAIRGEPRGGNPPVQTLLASLAFQWAFDGASAEQASSLAERALVSGVTTEQGIPPGPVWDAISTLVIAERFDAAEHHCNSALAAARANASRLGVLFASSFLSWLSYRRGSVVSADSQARTALESGPAVGFEIGMSSVATGWLIDALIERGALEQAADALAASGIVAQAPDNFMSNYLLRARGRLRLALGDTDAGIADLRELWERAAAWRGCNPVTLTWLSSDLAIALVRRGEVDEARRFAERELAVARAWGSPRAVGVALRTSALVDRGDREVELLTEAVTALERSEARLEHARALVDLGAALRRAGKQAAARNRLGEGMELAHRSAATALVERARDELHAAGVSPRRVAPSSADSLTPSERRVAELAAAGMSNKEIAQALFVTLRTVEMHLSNAYRKLHIASRRQLRGALLNW
jgi:DNA-binding SARP family transcriptional activator/DNA-binding CsgD family transcriptional regulator